MDTREKILESALSCIVDEGVAGLTLRNVAERAGVALGTVSYAFRDKDGLIGAAFASFADTSVERFDSHFTGIRSLEDARAATVAMLIDAARNRRDMILGAELYALSLRRPRHRLVLSNWTRRCRTTMERYFDPVTTNLLDALYEGLALHSSMKLDDYSREAIIVAVERLTPPESYLGPYAETFQLPPVR